MFRDRTSSTKRCAATRPESSRSRGGDSEPAYVYYSTVQIASRLQRQERSRTTRGGCSEGNRRFHPHEAILLHRSPRGRGRRAARRVRGIERHGEIPHPTLSPQGRGSSITLVWKQAFQFTLIVLRSVRRHPEVRAVFGEPRRMGVQYARPSFEARKVRAPQDDVAICGKRRC